MSFIQQYLQSRAEASSPAYAAKQREIREEQRLEKAARKMSAMTDQLYGRQAQPAQYSDAFSPEEIQGMPPEMLAEMETQGAVEGRGLLGQDISPEQRTDIEQRRDLMGSDNSQMQRAALKMLMSRQQDNRDVRQRREEGTSGRQFADQWLNLGNRYMNPATGVSHDIARAPSQKTIDLGDSYMFPESGEIVKKNLAKREIDTSIGKSIGSRLKGFNNVIATGDSVMDSLRQTSQLLDGLGSDTDWTNTGWASLVKDIPTFPAMSWNEKKEVIVSRLAVDKMSELKAMSPSGSTGFGALSERELDLLQKQLGSLEQAQGEKPIKKQIAQIQKLIKGSINKFSKARTQEVSWFNRNRTSDLEEWKEGPSPEKPGRGKVIKWADYKKMHGLK